MFVAVEPETGACQVHVSTRRTKKEWALFLREVMDTLKTHTPFSFSEVFEPTEARRLTEKRGEKPRRSAPWTKNAGPRPVGREKDSRKDTQEGRWHASPVLGKVPNRPHPRLRRRVPQTPLRPTSVGSQAPFFFRQCVLHEQLTEAVRSWTTLMGSPGPERSSKQPVPPGEAVRLPVSVDVPHAKDGVPPVSACVLLWHGRVPHACGRVPLASLSDPLLCVASIKRPAPGGCACAPPRVPVVARLFGSFWWLAGLAVVFRVVRAQVSDLLVVGLIAARRRGVSLRCASRFVFFPPCVPVCLGG